MSVPDAVLGWAARNGRICLVTGLAAGIALPGLAAWLRPFLPHFVAALLFVSALRIGPRAALGSLVDARDAVGLILVYQVALPISALLIFAGLGMAHTPLALAVTLMLAAPSVTGAPNFAILMGHDPAPALRLLVLGTTVLPVTVLPVLLLLPGSGDPAQVLGASLRLLAVIGGAVAVAFTVRATVLPAITAPARHRLDGLSAILLGVVVVALMAALGPALADRPGTVAGWAAAVFAVNFGLQAAAFALLRRRPGAVAQSIVAGNRNVALFLVAMPDVFTDPLLVFVGCYQLPMYLTPVLLTRLYGRGLGRGSGP